MTTEYIKIPSFRFQVQCLSKDGIILWTEDVHNLVTTQGGNDLIDKYFKGSTYTATWYMGLKGTGSPVVGDTASSHSGWAEVTPYAGNRPAISFGTTSGRSNTATVVSYTINASTTAAGCFVQSVNSGTSGILYSASDFSTSHPVVSGDTMNVTLVVQV